MKDLDQLVDLAEIGEAERGAVYGAAWSAAADERDFAIGYLASRTGRSPRAVLAALDDYGHPDA
jgi:hypothetical protein